MTAPPDFDASEIVKLWQRDGGSLATLVTVIRGVRASAYAAGAAAEREAILDLLPEDAGSIASSIRARANKGADRGSK
jgi:hypothetical protein